MSQDEIRNWFNSYLKVTPIAIDVLAKSIDVSGYTMRRFLKGAPLRTKSWSKMNEFITEKLKNELSK
jgi:hypothetical protein